MNYSPVALFRPSARLTVKLFHSILNFKSEFQIHIKRNRKYLTLNYQINLHGHLARFQVKYPVENFSERLISQRQKKYSEIFMTWESLKRHGLEIIPKSKIQIIKIKKK